MTKTRDMSNFFAPAANNKFQHQNPTKISFQINEKNKKR